MKTQIFRGMGRYSSGYTIIEVLIFLAISGGLLVASASLISGRQERIRFTNSIDQLELQLNDTFNDVSTGFFPSNSDFTCSSDTNNNLLFDDMSSTEQGSNEGCIFVGKLLHFHAGDFRGDPLDNNQYNTYTLVGARGAADISDGEVVLLGYTTTDTFGNQQVIPGTFETENLGADIILPRPSGSQDWQVYNSTNSDQYHSIIVATVFNEAVGPNQAATGNSARVKLFGYKGWDYENALLDSSSANLVPIEDSQTLIVCLEQNGGGRKAAIEISAQLTTDKMFDSRVPAQCS